MIHIALEDLKLIAGGDKQNDSLSITTGPIMNNYHAQVVCPIVVKIHSDSFEGVDFEWNGHWTTIVTNEMSICGAKLINS